MPDTYALIIGSGFEKFASGEANARSETRFGLPSADLRRSDIHGHSVLSIARHGEPHTIPPHAINYRANLVALEEAGATAIIALIIPWWPWYTRLVQGEVLSIKQTLYVEAAQMLGYGKLYIIFRHILPNIMTPVMVMILLDLGPAIIAIGLLSFIGLGTQPPMADWGLMVWEGAPNILSEWWISIVPGCAMFIVVIAFNIFGDALKDILDSKG